MSNDDNNMRLVEFPANAFIELDDPTTGKRRLVMVCDSGTEFVDYIDFDNPPTPLAILEAFDPVAWGDASALSTNLLLVSGDYPGYVAFSDFLQALSDSPAAKDTLTFNRAAKWAFESKDYDVAKAANAGLLATAEARARQRLITDTAASWIATGAV